MGSVHRSAKAEEDLIEVWLHIATDNPQAADHLLDQIDAKCHMLAEHPRLGQARSDIAQGLRYFPAGSYLLLYRERPDGIELVRVLHGSRYLTDIL